MENLYKVIFSLLFLFGAARVYGQPAGSSMSNPVNAGTQYNCTGAPYTSVMNNNPANGYGNSYGQPSHDIYYRFVLTEGSKVYISLCGSDFDTYLHLLNSSGTLLASNDDNGPDCTGTSSSMEVNLSAGTYYAIAEGYSTNYGNIHISIAAYPPAGISNSSGPARAVNWGVLTAGRSNSGNANTSCLKSNYNGQPSNDMWYKFTLNDTLEVEINTCYSNFDTYLSVLGSDLSLIASNDDHHNVNSSCPMTTSYLKMKLPPGTYYVVGEGYQNSTGSLTTNIQLPWQLPADGKPVLAAVPSQNQNYITTYTPKIKDLINEGQLNVGSIYQVNQEVQYFDGLGRPLQTVQIKGSPDGTKDLVQPVAYDKFGNEPRKYLPYAAASNNGSYKSDALSPGAGVLNFYNPLGSTGNQLSNGVARIPTPYADTEFEISPLNRVFRQGAPGDAWQLSQEHTLKMAYLSNTGNEVRQYHATPVQAPGEEYKRNLILAAEAYYGAKQLYKTVVKDENWQPADGTAGTVEEFKDKQEKVILKRSFNKTDTGIEILSTYYIYDDFGNLCFVLPPGANPDSGLPDQAALNNYCYQYQYDKRKLLIEKKLPGKGWEYLVYNKADLLILTQDAKQRINNRWMFVKYDALSRVVMTGLSTITGSRPMVQSLADAHINLQEHRDISNLVTGYSSGTQTFPVTGINYYLMINYYDDYRFPGVSAVSAAGHSIQTNGLLTGTRVYTDDGLTFYLGGIYYDDKGLNVETISQNHLGGTDKIVSAYDFTGQLTSRNRSHVANSQTTTIANYYKYDHVGRKIQTRQRINSDPEVVLSKLSYNDIGQLVKKEVHSTDNGITFLQNMGYSYNERGWISEQRSNEFSMRLKYNDGTVPQYNGNIANQDWGAGSAFPNSYNYGYDKLNRLLSGISTGVVMSETLGYDIMGNIKTLSRDSGAEGIYNYSGNQLTNISGGPLTTGIYLYDLNGNAVTDGRTGVVLTYNDLNLPSSASKTGLNLVYKYDAIGKKLQKISNGTTRQYVDGIEYIGNVIDLIHTEEGVARNNAGVYSYEYNITDHLGNVRYTFNKHPVTGQLQRLQSDNYYPFGLRKSSGSPVSENNKYLYNGKELQEELGQLDYGARFYDPVIGRWNVVDPLAEKMRRYSPYNYAFNNPIRFIDPDGREATDWVKGRNGIYWDKDAKSAATTKAGETYIGSKWSDVQSYQANNSTSPEPDGPKLSPGKSSTPEETAGREATYQQSQQSTAVDYQDMSQATTSLAVTKNVAYSFAGEYAAAKLAPLVKGLFSSGAVQAEKSVFTVTSEGIVLPKGVKIPNEFVENPFRSSNYGVMENGKFVEKLRIDPATPVNMKGPGFSHFHLDGGKEHIFDISRWPYK